MWAELKRPVLLCGLIIVVCLVMQAMAGNFAIVNNNTGAGTAEDTITCRVRVPDSAGQVTTADSFYVWVFYPTGELAYSSGYVTAADQITAHAQAGRTVYTWTEAVATIDGTPRVGTYCGDFCAVNTTLGLEGWSSFSFVLEPTLAERTVIGDTIGRNASVLVVTDNIGINFADISNASSSQTFSGATIGTATNVTNQVTTVWTAANRDTVLDRTIKALDSIIAVLDTLQDGFSSRSFIGINLDAVTGAFEANDFEASCLDDKGNWNVGKTGYSLAVIGLDNDSSFTNLQAAVAALDFTTDGWGDTLMMWLGYVAGAVSRTDYAATQDTIWIINGSDTLGKIIYYHPGGSAGDAPDSTKTEVP